MITDSWYVPARATTVRPAGAASTALWMVAYGEDLEPDPVFEPVGDTNTASAGTA